jgi:hypothetical protein
MDQNRFRHILATLQVEAPKKAVDGELQNRPGPRDVAMLHGQIFDL